MPSAIAFNRHDRSTSRSFTVNPVIVCFSHLRWNFVFQRPQHLMTRAARTFRVVFVEEPEIRPVALPVLETRSGDDGVTVAVPILPEGLTPAETAAAQRMLVDDLVAGLSAGPLVFWYYTPMALEFTRHHAPDLVVYDNMDELSAFLGAPRKLLDLERELFSRADLVFTGGVSLFEAKRGRHHAIHAFPSSIDAAHFGAARTRPAEPADLAVIARPRLGFFGVIDERMDVDLVGACADLRPDWQFVMLGPIVKIDPARLPQRANIHWLGGKSYAGLPDYLGGWDVGIMPFAINEATRYISPTKTPEFLAAGVRVVSTPIRDVIRPYGERGLVAIASTPGAFVAAAERMMQEPRGPWLERVDAFLSGMSWDRTFADMRRLMLEALAASAVADLPLAAGLAASAKGKGVARV
jgi:hypothetical protein